MKARKPGNHNDEGARIAKRLLAHRSQRELTQEQVADHLGITRQMYHKYETGATRLKAAHVKALCTFLEITPDMLFGFDPPAISPRAMHIAAEAAHLPPRLLTMVRDLIATLKEEVLNAKA